MWFQGLCASLRITISKNKSFCGTDFAVWVFFCVKHRLISPCLSLLLLTNECVINKSMEGPPKKSIKSLKHNNTKCLTSPPRHRRAVTTFTGIYISFHPERIPISASYAAVIQSPQLQFNISDLQQRRWAGLPGGALGASGPELQGANGASSRWYF